jgi:hypothetical protein
MTTWEVSELGYSWNGGTRWLAGSKAVGTLANTDWGLEGIWCSQKNPKTQGFGYLVQVVLP